MISSLETILRTKFRRTVCDEKHFEIKIFIWKKLSVFYVQIVTKLLKLKLNNLYFEGFKVFLDNVESPRDE